jgi:hypothetical protein
MPRAKADFERLYPCDFFEPADLLEPDRMYTVLEVAKLLQGLEPDADVEPDVESVLLDWAVPWIVYRSEDLVVAEPPTADEPGYYGLRTEGDPGGDDASGADVPGDGGSP